MRRAVTVVLIGLLFASVSGINDASLAQGAGQASDGRQQDIAAQAARIGVNHVVRIERTDGSRSDAMLEEILPDAVVVTILEEQDRRRETIPFAEIRRIDEVRGHALRNILIGVGIGVAVLVGTCAVAMSNQESPQVKPADPPL